MRKDFALLIFLTLFFGSACMDQEDDDWDFCLDVVKEGGFWYKQPPRFFANTGSKEYKILLKQEEIFKERYLQARASRCKSKKDFYKYVLIWIRSLLAQVIKEDEENQNKVMNSLGRPQARSLNPMTLKDIEVTADMVDEIEETCKSFDKL